MMKSGKEVAKRKIPQISSLVFLSSAEAISNTERELRVACTSLGTRKIEMKCNV